MGVDEIELTPLGKEILGVDTLVCRDEFLFGCFFDRFAVQNLQEMHHDHVPFVPPSFHLLGSTSTSYNEGMVRYTDDSSIPIATNPTSRPLTDIHILTFQGHPEFTESIVSLMANGRAEKG